MSDLILIRKVDGEWPEWAVQVLVPLTGYSVGVDVLDALAAASPDLDFKAAAGAVHQTMAEDEQWRLQETVTAVQARLVEAKYAIAIVNAALRGRTG